MENIKIGGKITLENEEYVIVKVLKVDDKDYLFCTTTVGKIMPAVLEYKYINNELNVRLENDENLINNICQKIKDSIK